MTPQEVQARNDTAHIHIKVLIDKLKVVWAEGADHTDYSTNHAKWLNDKALQAGAEKVLGELITFYSDLIDQRPKEVEKTSGQHW